MSIQIPRRTSAVPSVEVPDAQPALKAAYDRALLFPVNRTTDLILGPAQIKEWAQQEAAFGRAVVDNQGLTPGMRLHIMQSGRALLAEWRQARSQFDRVLEPVMKDIRAVIQLDEKVEEIKRRRDAEISQEERVLEADRRFVEVKDEYKRSEDRFENLRVRHGNRTANCFGHTYYYLLALLCVGAVEWLINYDTFLLFTGVPAIAAGATIILGILLSGAAHGHGVVLKQWAFRFGEHRSSADRFSDYRLFGLSTIAALIVFAAAGGSRYGAAMHALAGQAQGNILGADAIIQVNPVRDVLLSLLANVAAWLVGVLLAYFSHDPDPDFMDATRQFRIAAKRYHSMRKPIVGKIRTVEARHSVEMRSLEMAAQTRAIGVETERSLLEQVNAHENAILRNIASVMRSNLENYRDTLAQIALTQRQSPLTFIDHTGQAAMSPFEFKSKRLPDNKELQTVLVS